MTETKDSSTSTLVAKSAQAFNPTLEQMLDGMLEAEQRRYVSRAAVDAYMATHWQETISKYFEDNGQSADYWSRLASQDQLGGPVENALENLRFLAADAVVKRELGKDDEARTVLDRVTEIKKKVLAAFDELTRPGRKHVPLDMKASSGPEPKPE